MTSTTLFLNENPLPTLFTKGTIAAKELRLRAALPQIDTVHVLAPIGNSVTSGELERGPLEKKIIVHRLFPTPYYFRTIPLIFQGLYLTLKLHPRVIEAESPIISGPAAVVIGKLTNTKSVIEVRSTFNSLIHHKLRILPLFFKRNILNIVQGLTLKTATGIIANSRHYASWLLKSNLQSTVINPGLQYAPRKPQSSKRKQSTLTIGYLGRLVPEKGIHILIKALKLLEKTKLPTFQVEIAGTGPEEKRLKSQASDLKTHIFFLGPVNNYQTLSRWQLLINPCLVDAPLEMVNAEAAYMGVPVICFGAKQLPETVRHNETGLILNQKSVKALALAIKKLVLNSKLRQKFSKSGPVFAQSGYSFQSQVKTLKRFYQKIGVIHV